MSMKFKKALSENLSKRSRLGEIAAIVLLAVLIVVGSAFGISNAVGNNNEPKAKEKPVLRQVKMAETETEIDIYKKQSSDAKVIATVPSGEDMRIIESAGGWYFVEYGDNTGWCPDENLQIYYKKVEQ